VTVIEDALAALRRNEALVVPTDTVYGLVATAFRDDAAQRLYRLKGRPPQQPLALMAPDVDTLLEIVPELHGRAGVIARTLLPGPYTLVLPNPAHRYRWLTGNRPETIGVRVAELPEPSASILRELGAFASTSANLSGGPDPARPDDVAPELRKKVAAIIDGGELPGTPSTVIDFSEEEPRVLREGAASADEAIERARAAVS
jgi:L-threonylcarbamoyladenylate synthase